MVPVPSAPPDPRIWLASGLAALVVPALTVGLAAFGPVERMDVRVVAIVVTVVAALVVYHGWRRLPDQMAAPMLGRPRRLAGWVALVLLATVQTGRLSVFMHDAGRTDCSVFPARGFFHTHICLSAYTEAARLAPTAANIFAVATYADRRIGPFQIDLYQYPPAFLLLGAAFNGVSADFLTVRAIWFAAQSLSLMAACLALAVWIGGMPGARAAWLIPVLWLAQTTQVALQLGNFQVSAFSWSIAAMVLIAGGWIWAAAPLLGFCAAGKVFPAVLGLYLVAAGRWRAAIACGVSGLAWVLAAFLVFGPKPFVDFIQYQAPRISSGDAFFWIDLPDFVAVNQSVYGIVVKLRHLFWPGPARAIGNVAAGAYGLAVLVLAVMAGWRRRRTGLPGAPPSRGTEAGIWLALLNLASLRSPFVPDAYAYVGTIWLGILLVADLPRLGARSIALCVTAWLLLSLVFHELTVLPTPAWIVVLSLITQLLAYSINLGVVIRAIRSRPVPALAAVLSERAA